MEAKSFGQLLGLILEKGAITEQEIKFTTSSPKEAKHYLSILKQTFGTKETDLTYYIDDVQYGRDDVALKRFENSIKISRTYLFHRPEANLPKLTIIQKDKRITELISLSETNIQLLQKNTAFSKGFIDALLSNSTYDAEARCIHINYNKNSPLLVNSLEELYFDYEQHPSGIILRDNNDLLFIRKFSQLSRNIPQREQKIFTVLNQ